MVDAINARTPIIKYDEFLGYWEEGFNNSQDITLKRRTYTDSSEFFKVHPSS